MTEYPDRNWGDAWDITILKRHADNIKANDQFEFQWACELCLQGWKAGLWPEKRGGAGR